MSGCADHDSCKIFDKLFLLLSRFRNGLINVSISSIWLTYVHQRRSSVYREGHICGSNRIRICDGRHISLEMQVDRSLVLGEVTPTISGLRPVLDCSVLFGQTPLVQTMFVVGASVDAIFTASVQITHRIMIDGNLRRWTRKYERCELNHSTANEGL